MRYKVIFEKTTGINKSSGVLEPIKTLQYCDIHSSVQFETAKCFEINFKNQYSNQLAESSKC